MIAGTAPRLEWRPNPESATRTIGEAYAIARRWGVEISIHAQFAVDESNDLD